MQRRLRLIGLLLGSSVVLGACGGSEGSSSECNNGVCDPGETAARCPQDCGQRSCPDGACNGGETPATCPQDCAQSTCPSDTVGPPADVLDGDVLRYQDVLVGVGTVHCLRDLTVLRPSDGCSWQVPALAAFVSLRVANETIVQPASESDCDGGVGIIGLAPGQAAATITLDAVSTSIESVIAVSAAAVSPESRAVAYPENPLHLETPPFDTNRSRNGMETWLSVGDTMQGYINACQITLADGHDPTYPSSWVRSWYDLRAADRSVLEISADPCRSGHVWWLFRGLAPGRTVISLSYGASGQPPIEAATGNVEVLSPAAQHLVELFAALTDDLDCSADALSVGACAEGDCAPRCAKLRIVGRMDVDDDSIWDYSREVGSGETVTTNERVEYLAADHTVCGIQSGLGRVDSCVGAICAEPLFAFVSQPGEFLSFLPEPAEIDGRADTRQCTEFQFWANRSDGTRWNIAAWPTTTYGSSSGVAFVSVEADTTGLTDQLTSACVWCNSGGSDHVVINHPGAASAAIEVHCAP